ncbi:hypothetical protein ID866_1459 [Astraeus odoratus]|nr:hypothetical protein ID866_1459 [Astraeus odoratus]
MCHFAHPSDPEWRSAKSSYPPRSDLVADDDSQFYYSLVDPDRRRGSYDEHNLRRDSRSQVLPPPSSPRSKRRTVDSAMEASASARRRSRSPAPSSSSEQMSRVPPPFQKGGSIDSHANRRNTDDIKDPRLQSSNSRRTSSPQASQVLHKEALPSSSHPPDPSESSHLRPEQPPPPGLPPIPVLPAFASQQTSPKESNPTSHDMKGLSLDEQRKVWHERIDLIFASMTSRRDFAKIEKDLESIRQLGQSQRAASLPEEEKSKLCDQRIALEQQLDGKRKEVNDTLQRLIGTSFWPIMKAPELQNFEKTFVEVKGYVVEVRNSLEELRSSCNTLFDSHGVPSGGTDKAPEDAERPLKRRRVSEDTGTPIQDTGSSTTQPFAEMTAFHDRLTLLSRQVSDLENHINQRQQIMEDEIVLRIDERLEEEGLFSPVEAIRIPEADIVAVVDAHNAELVKAIQTAESEVGLLAEEVATLITQRHELEQRCIRFETEIADLRGAIAELTTECESEDPEKLTKEVQALNAALQACISQVSPPAIDTGLSADYVLESLDNQVVVIVREKFTPLLVKIRQELVDKVNDNHIQTHNTLFPKVDLLTRMVNIVTARVSAGLMTSECARTTGSAKPDTTMVAVIKRPRSTAAVFDSYEVNSSKPQWANNAFGKGASTNVRAATSCETGVREVTDDLLADQQRKPISPESAGENNE